jgi:hypothetical protein
MGIGDYNNNNSGRVVNMLPCLSSAPSFLLIIPTSNLKSGYFHNEKFLRTGDMRIGVISPPCVIVHVMAQAVSSSVIPTNTNIRQIRTLQPRLQPSRPRWRKSTNVEEKITGGRSSLGAQVVAQQEAKPDGFKRCRWSA